MRLSCPICLEQVELRYRVWTLAFFFARFPCLIVKFKNLGISTGNTCDRVLGFRLKFIMGNWRGSVSGFRVKIKV